MTRERAATPMVECLNDRLLLLRRNLGWEEELGGEFGATH